MVNMGHIGPKLVEKSVLYFCDFFLSVLAKGCLDLKHCTVVRTLIAQLKRSEICHFIYENCTLLVSLVNLQDPFDLSIKQIATSVHDHSLYSLKT